MQETIYTVVTTIQSGDNPPVNIVYYRGTDGMQALSAVGSAATTYDDHSQWGVRTLSVRLQMEQVEAEPKVADCANADCGHGECSYLQTEPGMTMCDTHRNGEGRCQPQEVDEARCDYDCDACRD